MSIEIGSKWVKDGEVVEITNIIETVGRDEVIYYKCKQNKSHVMYDYDFLEQYTPYEVVYEYRWATEERYGLAILDRYLTEEEIGSTYGARKQRLDFTKRERT